MSTTIHQRRVVHSNPAGQQSINDISSSLQQQYTLKQLPDETEQEYQQRINKLHKINIIHSIAWLIAAIVIIYYYDLYNVLFKLDQRLNIQSLYIALFTLLALILDILYIMFFVQNDRSKDNNTNDLMSMAPYTIYIAALTSVLTCLSFIITLWPIYTYMSIPIVFICSMATVLSTNFITSFS